MCDEGMDNVDIGDRAEDIEEIHREEKEKVRFVDLSGLPRWGEGEGSGHGNVGTIKWEESIGCLVSFEFDDIKGKFEIVEYGKKGSLKLKYKNNIIQTYTPSLLKNQLTKILSFMTSEFKIEIGRHFKDDKRDITIIDRKYIKNKNGQNYKYYKYKCNLCGFECGEHYKDGELKDEHWTSESSLLGKQKTGCACCCTPSQITVFGYNDIYSTEKWMLDYFIDIEDAKKYTKSSMKQLRFKCPTCGKIRNKLMSISTLNKTKSVACTYCSDGKSYPEKFAYSMLEQLNISFETEYSPEWIKPKRYDFYFEKDNKKYIIEMDGKLGHGKDIHSRSNKTKEETIQNDIYKDLKANENGIKVMRINSDESDMEFIKNNIYTSELTNILDLNKVNWLKCHEKALSNKIKEVCDYWNNKEGKETTTDLLKYFKTDRSTIIDYLKKGNELGWTNYIPNQYNKKQIEVFKDGNSLGIYLSGMYISDNSEKIFGIKLNWRNISQVCLGRKKSHKGFTFKYVDKIDNQPIA